jgi:hypothetical protein
MRRWNQTPRALPEVALLRSKIEDRLLVGALTCFVAPTRARGTDRAAPAAAAAATAVVDSFFANSGSRIGASAGAAAGAVGGAGDGAGRAELSYGDVADAMAPTAARQGGARARSRPAAALKDQGKRGRVNLLRRPHARESKKQGDC